VPADFRVPRGWPTPTDKWVRDNAFWQPAAGWSPPEAAAAAPDGWEFWTPNKLWWQTTGAYYRSIAIWGRLSNWLGYLFVVALIGSAFLGPSPMLRLVGFSAALASIALLIVTRFSRRGSQRGCSRGSRSSHSAAGKSASPGSTSAT
jgi:hypothetical protein